MVAGAIAVRADVGSIMEGGAVDAYWPVVQQTNLRSEAEPHAIALLVLR